MPDAPPRARFVVGLALGLGTGLLWKDLGLRGMISYWGSAAPIVVLFGLVGGLVWKTRLRVLVAIAPAALMLLWLVVAFTPLCRLMGRGLVVAQDAVPADAIFVLSSDIQSDDEPSTSALARGTRGLELLGQGLAPRLLLSELASPAGSYKRYLVASATKLGVRDPSAIVDVGFVYNTHDEALRVAALFREHGWRKLLLVTSPVHSRRAVAVFARAGVPEVISVPAVETRYDLQHLNHPDDKLDAFGAMLHEWVGLAVYRWRGWI